MKRLLLVTRKTENSSLEKYLVSLDLYDTTVAYSISAAKEELKNDYDIVAINCPLEGEFGDDFSLWAAENCSAAVVALMKKEISEKKRGDLENRGVYIISKPSTRHHILKVLKYAGICNDRILTITKENEKLQKRLDSLKTISRAKIALVKYLNMTESEAHRYIEQEAMKRRISKLDLSLKIIRNYED